MTTNLTISAKTKNSIFKILGTAQFELEITQGKYEYEVTLLFPKNQSRGNYVTNFHIWKDELWQQELLTEMYEGKEALRKKMKENAENKQKEKEENEKLEKLEKKYDEMVAKKGWFFAPDMCFFVSKEDALTDEMVWGFKENTEWNAMRHSFVMEVHGAEIIRYCHVENCYYSLVNYDLVEKVETKNWYSYGFHHGYNDCYCDGMYNEGDPSPLPDFPNSVAKEVFYRGMSHGGHQGYMDT